MRIFSAILLDKKVKDFLYTIKFKTKLAGISWVPKKNLHITLKFFGNISEDSLQEIIKNLDTIKLKSFKLNLTNIGFFPDSEDIKIIWVGINPKEKVIELQRVIDEKTINLTSSVLEFSAHITLGRVKFIKDIKKLLEIIKDKKIENIEFDVTEFYILKSILTKDNPKYKTIKSFQLNNSFSDSSFNKNNNERK